MTNRNMIDTILVANELKDKLSYTHDIDMTNDNTTALCEKVNKSNIVTTDSQSVTTSVSEMNVIALRLFQKGDGRTAIVTLLRAVWLVRMGSSSSNNNTDWVDVKNDWSSSSDGILPHFAATTIQHLTIATSSVGMISSYQQRHGVRMLSSSSSLLHPTNMMTSNRSGIDINSSNDLYLYCKPFLILNTNTDRNHDASLPTTTNVLCHPSCRPEVSAALFFNMALMHHIAGMKRNGNTGSSSSGGSGNSSLLKKALLCYEESLRHIHYCTTNVAVLVVAICNNRLHLYHHYFYDSIQGKQQLKLMDQALTRIEHTYVRVRHSNIGSSGRMNSNRHQYNSSDVLTDPQQPSQTLSMHDLHQFRLTYAFTAMHDFRLSPAA